jgi:glutathione S-transferase
VPVLLFDDGRVIADSLEIARWGDAHGSAPSLLQPEHGPAIARWVERSEVGMSAGRALSLLRLLHDRDGLEEMVPKRLRRFGLGARIGAIGIARTLRKYGGDRKGIAAHEAELSAVLDELRAALHRVEREPRTLLERFSFADIAMAQTLSFVQPPPFGLRLGRATRRAFYDPRLGERYSDLIAWRDALYEHYRPRVGSDPRRAEG